MHNENPNSGTLPDIYPAVSSLFEEFELDECESELWKLAAAYFGQPDNYIWTQDSRANTAYFCAKLSALFKNLYRIWEGTKKSVSEVAVSS